MFRPLFSLIFLTVNRWICLQVYYLIWSSFANRIYFSEMNYLWFLLIIIINLILDILKLPIIIKINIICYALNIILILDCRLPHLLSSQMLILINFSIILKLLIFYLLIILFALKAIYGYNAFLSVTSIILDLRIHLQ